MKIYYILIFLIFLSSGYPDDFFLEFAKNAGGSNDDVANDIVILSDGSSVIAGHFSGTATFGKNETNQTTLTSAGNKDIFIAKYNKAGKLEWAKHAGGVRDDIAAAIDCQPDGSITITGYYGLQAIFGSGESKQTTLNSVGGSDVYVAKYTSAGYLTWAKSAGSLNDDSGSKITSQTDGGYIVSGRFWGTAMFGPGESYETTLIAQGADDIFIAKYKFSGLLEWAKSAGGGFSDDCVSISNFDDGSFAATGFFQGTAIFGNNEINKTTLYSQGAEDIFIARYKSNGQLSWAKSAGGVYSDRGSGAAVQSNNKILVTGYFQNQAAFGESGSQTSIFSLGDSDIFLAMYNYDGKFNWVKKSGGINNDIGSDVKILPDKSILMIGSFSAQATFNSGASDSKSVLSSGSHDIFISHWTSGGGLKWVKKAGGSMDDFAQRLYILNDRVFAITGYYGAITGGSATFGSGESKQTILNSIGSSDIFIAIYNKPFNFYICY